MLPQQQEKKYIIHKGDLKETMRVTKKWEVKCEVDLLDYMNKVLDEAFESLKPADRENNFDLSELSSACDFLIERISCTEVLVSLELTEHDRSEFYKLLEKDLQELHSENSLIE